MSKSSKIVICIKLNVKVAYYNPFEIQGGSSLLRSSSSVFCCLLQVTFERNVATCVTKLGGDIRASVNKSILWCRRATLHHPVTCEQPQGKRTTGASVWKCCRDVWRLSVPSTRSSTSLCFPQVGSTAFRRRSKDSWLRRLISSYCFSSKQPSSSVLCTSVESSKFIFCFLMDYLPQWVSTQFWV